MKSEMKPFYVEVRMIDPPGYLTAIPKRIRTKLGIDYWLKRAVARVETPEEAMEMYGEVRHRIFSEGWDNYMGVEIKHGCVANLR